MHLKPAAHRVLTSLEQPFYQLLAAAAQREHISLSQKVRDLLKSALELEEDEALEALVEERKKRGGKFLNHGDFWRRAHSRTQ